MSWWDNPDYTALLVATAADLDRRYPDRAVYAVGHTPSWLVHALGALRARRGEPPRIGYIPFSGALLEVERTQMYSTVDGNVLQFVPDGVRQASPAALSGYFNYLARRGVDPRNVLHTQATDETAAGPPVLVDYAARGKGMATFLQLYDGLAARQGVAGLADGFAVCAYKMAFRDGPLRWEYPALDGAARRGVDVTLVNGAPGLLMNMISGYQGCPQNRGDRDAAAQEKGRFMPYYPVCDSYNPESHWRGTPAPVPGLRPAGGEAAAVRSAKVAIREAVRLYHKDPEIHARRAAAGAARLEAGAPPLARAGIWTPVVRGYHG